MRKLARSAPQTDNAEDQKVLIAVRIAFIDLSFNRMTTGGLRRRANRLEGTSVSNDDDYNFLSSL